MVITMRPVTVHEVPDHVTAAVEKKFLRNLQQYVETERPRLVLDCSKIRQMDNATIHLLLSCLEEVMKRNGDVKLAAVHADGRSTLQVTGVHRLFEMYATPSEAAHSFQRRGASLLPGLDAADLEGDAESAA
ncbi:MAG: STAS domain-containing protein [Acidobacteriaceae bacterium]